MKTVTVLLISLAIMRLNCEGEGLSCWEDKVAIRQTCYLNLFSSLQGVDIIHGYAQLRLCEFEVVMYAYTYLCPSATVSYIMI